MKLQTYDHAEEGRLSQYGEGFRVEYEDEGGEEDKHGSEKVFSRLPSGSRSGGGEEGGCRFRRGVEDGGLDVREEG